MIRYRKAITSGLGVAGFALALAVPVWACTQQPNVSVNPPSGQGGSVVSVSGGAFSSGPVTIHWDSASGPVLGTAQGPNFAVAVRIPNAGPNVYSIVANQGLTSQATAAFQITPRVTAPGPPGTDNGGGGSIAPADSGFGYQGTAPGTSGGAGAQGQGTSRSTDTPGSPGNRSLAPQDVAGRDRVQGAALVPGTAGTRPLGVGPDTPGTSAAAAGIAQGSDPGTLSSRSVSGDLWGGFARQAKPAGPGAGLAGGAVATSSNRAMVAGAALLSLGVIALLAGFALPELQRRRVRAVSKN